METLSGVQRPRSYTSHAMTQYAYTRAQQPGPGSVHPFGVVTPMNKNAEWWGMDWMHRESFFLPRYDAKENMVAKGHALAADAGIACITRRLVHAPKDTALRQARAKETMTSWGTSSSPKPMRLRSAR